MKIIRNSNGNIFNILPIQDEHDATEYVYHRYLIKEGDLIYNSLTGEAISDVDEDTDREELIKRWYLVPSYMDFSGFFYLIRQIIQNRNMNSPINKYTIFTTMRCNAACEYCFQHGGSDSVLTDDKARDIAYYIQSHANQNNPVEISWFGGEPLVNKEMITKMTSYLRNKNFNVRSSISTNGDLFPTVTDAEIYLWNLKKAQFTIDSPGSEYDRIKGLPDGAYDRLKATVGRLVNLGVRAQIRVHYHPEYENAMDVAKSIVDDFKEYPNVLMYPAMIYDDPKTISDYENLAKLEGYMIESKVLNFNPMSPRRSSNCMADDPTIRCIRVDGSFTPCEHYSEGEQYGTIYSNSYDESMLRKWKLKRKYQKQCFDCPIFPLCEIIENCPSTGICEEGYKNYKIEQIKMALRHYQEDLDEQGEIN